MKIENEKAYIPCEIVETQINNGLDIRVRIDKTHDLYINRKLLIPDIDQPKPLVPQFVAEWIEKYKKNRCRLSHALDHVFDDVELGLYIKRREDDYTEIIAKAWLYGYTVEKEKLFTVEIPDPNSKDTVYCLFKDEDGQVKIGSVLSLETEADDSWRDDPDMQLTEQEIRKDFEWAWRWKKEVRE